MTEIGAEKEKLSWHMQFNPCGVSPVNGFSYNSCVSVECGSIPCFAKAAHAMSEYLLKGCQIDGEKEEMDKCLRSYVGKNVITPSGEVIQLTRENVPEILDQISDNAQQISAEVDMCTRMGLPLTDEYLQKCSYEQRQVLMEMERKQRIMGSYDPSSGQRFAEKFVGEMQELVNEALNVGLGELGLVARMAISYGMGERVPQFSSEHIFRYPGNDGLVPIKNNNI